MASAAGDSQTVLNELEIVEIGHEVSTDLEAVQVNLVPCKLVVEAKAFAVVADLIDPGIDLDKAVYPRILLFFDSKIFAVNRK